MSHSEGYGVNSNLIFKVLFFLTVLSACQSSSNDPQGNRGQVSDLPPSEKFCKKYQLEVAKIRRSLSQYEIGVFKSYYCD